jgi:hypothetical protein
MDCVWIVVGWEWKWEVGLGGHYHFRKSLWLWPQLLEVRAYDSNFSWSSQTQTIQRRNGLNCPVSSAVEDQIHL